MTKEPVMLTYEQASIVCDAMHSHVQALKAKRKRAMRNAGFIGISDAEREIEIAAARLVKEQFLDLWDMLVKEADETPPVIGRNPPKIGGMRIDELQFHLDAVVSTLWPAEASARNSHRERLALLLGFILNRQHDFEEFLIDRLVRPTGS